MRIKLILALPLLLTACGPVGGPFFIEPARGQPLTSSGTGDEPVACSVICEQVREQLVRDFAVLPQSINCFEFNDANTCTRCNEKFVERYGVSLTQCP